MNAPIDAENLYFLSEKAERWNRFSKKFDSRLTESKDSEQHELIQLLKLLK